MAKAPITEEIPESKIRNAIWYLKKNKTKKFVCDYLGIKYNTKKLDKIIEDFKAKEQREKDLKEKAKNKVFSKQEKDSICKEYLDGGTQSGIAKQWFISPQRVKKILIEGGVPIRARGKKKAAKVDHIVQDLEIKFNIGDEVFIASRNSFGIVHRVYDEDYLEYLERGSQKYVETYPFKPGPDGVTKNGFIEPAEGIHYEIYWLLDDGTQMKFPAMKALRNKIIKNIEETGREFYSIYMTGDHQMFLYTMRDEIFPIRNS